MQSLRLALVLVTIVALGACATRPPMDADVSLDQPVATDKGRVAGSGSDVRAFLGIPYAQPPVGEGRWRPPQPALPWAGVRDGSRFGPDCMQPAEYPELRGGRSRSGAAGEGPAMSEDCLSVNVWTPARRSGEKLPVLVWVYGGGFTYGSGSHPSYDGEALARRGIVVVNFNYRTGLFGFMSHPQLSAESPTRSSGNYGLMDQLAALQWVQRNIAAFGGDPGRVTVAGQSAGAMSISALMISGRAQGLFQQAILQSVGVMRPMADLASYEALGLAVGPDLQQLRAMSATALVDRLKVVLPPGRELTRPRGLGIIVDGDLVRTNDHSAYTQGRYLRVPMIVGTVANEGGGLARSLGIRDAEALRRYVATSFPGQEARAAQLYPVGGNDQVFQVLSDLVSDTQYRHGTRALMRIAAADEPRLWGYRFTQRRAGDAAEPIHGAELQYPFDNLQAPHRGRARPFDASDQQLARQMADAWARFVKAGDPNGADLPAWPRYRPADEQLLELGTPVKAVAQPAAPRLDFLQDYLYPNRR